MRWLVIKTVIQEMLITNCKPQIAIEKLLFPQQSRNSLQNKMLIINTIPKSAFYSRNPQKVIGLQKDAMEVPETRCRRIAGRKGL